jgi:subtilisin family serine protease
MRLVYPIACGEETMKKGLLSVASLLAILMALPAVSSTRLVARRTSANGNSGPRFILHASGPAASGIASRHGLSIQEQISGHDISLATAPAAVDESQLIGEVDADGDVAAFEPDGMGIIPEVASAPLPQSTTNILDAVASRVIVNYFGASVPNYYTNQPAAQIIRLSEAQRTFAAVGSGIVAIIDTGIDPTHPAFAGHLIDGYDFTRDLPGLPSEMADLTQSTTNILDQSTTNILDKKQLVVVNGSVAAILAQSTTNILDSTQVPAAFGHGTMVAGIIHLVAPNALILPLKAFNADGTSSTFDIVRAIYYAVDHGARVINMSFSMDQPSAELVRAINYADGKGVICVSSTGNSGKETVVYPASLQNVIGVASTNNLDVRSAFSNYGTAVADMTAPGELIITTYPGSSYAAASGTSFSAPLVSGTVALLQRYRTLSGLKRSDVSSALSRSAPAADELGWGRLDIVQAISKLAGSSKGSD